jgi:hypothetical protein
MYTKKLQKKKKLNLSEMFILFIVYKNKIWKNIVGPPSYDIYRDSFT